jgi:sulfhydrogenase subunit beta (sulfur reductase)
MHKFRYFVENYGEAGCVGCGRCIRGCPAGIDIREVLERVGAEGTKAQNSEAEA